jgi:hypothetical protein
MASLLNPKTFLFIYIKWFSLLYSNSRLISMIIILTCYHSKMQCILWKKLTLFLQNNITLQLNCTFVKGSQIWREKHPIKSLYIFLLTSLKSVYKLFYMETMVYQPPIAITVYCCSRFYLRMSSNQTKIGKLSSPPWRSTTTSLCLTSV